VRSAWKSDRGLVRENNEDFVIADDENGIFLLADGMGGRPGGEVASYFASTTAYETIKSLLREPGPQKELPDLLADALRAAHSAVIERSLAEPALRGMGTTLEMLVVRGPKAFICHIGDSRVYRFRRKLLRLVTTDDNYATFLGASRKATPARIIRSYSHILTQAVGTSDTLLPQFLELDVDPGELLLICSDGLNGALGHAEIGTIISSNRENPDVLASALVAAANQKGGLDNISVLVIEPLPISPFSSD
jgi:protein phosphatase